MFIGHLAVGFAAKRLEPQPSLASYFVAAQLPDVLWPVFLLAGAEHATIAPGDTAFTPLRFDSYPYSHSLVATLLWGGLLAALALARRHNKRGALLLAALAVSHWVLDFVTHGPDMPLWPGGGPKLGLGLWNSIPATLIVESTMFATGIALYVSATRARDAVGRFGLAGLVVLLLIFYLGAAFGPPPPSIGVVAPSTIVGIGLIAWLAWWMDRHRPPRRDYQPIP
jgi:membrane-bound metal-dependent hydrolase YbcI (DUF457 family)